MEDVWSLEEWWYSFNIFQSLFLLVKHGQTIQQPGKHWNGQRKSGSRNHSRIIQRGLVIAINGEVRKVRYIALTNPHLLLLGFWPPFKAFAFSWLATPTKMCCSKPGLCSSLAPFRQAPPSLSCDFTRGIVDVGNPFRIPFQLNLNLK